jgi:P27 family predicted phage terminase small subunit
MTARRSPRRPSPPASLSTRARAEWRRLAPIAHEVGTLTARSAKQFELLCEVLSTERQAREIVATEGLTTKSERGGAKLHPAARMLEVSRAQAAVMMRQFRLEPPKTPINVPSQKPNGKSTWSSVLK